MECIEKILDGGEQHEAAAGDTHRSPLCGAMMVTVA